MRLLTALLLVSCVSCGIQYPHNIEVDNEIFGDILITVAIARAPGTVDFEGNALPEESTLIIEGERITSFGQRTFDDVIPDAEGSTVAFAVGVLNLGQRSRFEWQDTIDSGHLKLRIDFDSARGGNVLFHDWSSF